MVVSGILAASAGMMFIAPMRSYIDVSRRAQLVDEADTSLRLMQREIRSALPNSLRISGSTIEFVPVLYAGRYRANLPEAVPGDVLDFTIADDHFAVLGDDVPSPVGSAWVAVFPFAADAIYNSASTENVRTALAGTTASNVTLAAAFRFGHSSPAARFYLVGQPVSYVCNTGTGDIYRHSAYGYSAVQNATPAGTADLLVQHVSACQFDYAAGTSSRFGVVSLRLTIRDAASAEQISLVEQVHVDNAP